MTSSVDSRLAELASSQMAAPEPSAELAALFAKPTAARARRPGRQLMMMSAASLVYAAGLVVVMSTRRDLSLLPRPWFIGYASAWLLSFASIAWIAIVPPRGSALLRWHAAAAATVVAAVGFVALGLAWTKAVPGVSMTYEPTLANVIKFAPACLGVGVFAALVPAVLCAMALRRAVPVGSRWVGAAVGAAGGALGGLVLHFHCPIAEASHVASAHGGAVALAAILGACVMPRFTAP